MLGVYALHPREAPDYRLAAEARYDLLGDGDNTQGHVEAQPAFPPESAGVSEARANLESIRQPGKGTVENHWSAEGILRLLTLTRNLRPGASLKNTLGVACGIFFSVQGERLSGDLEHGRLPLPSMDWLRMGKLRLDVLSIMYQRCVFLQWVC